MGFFSFIIQFFKLKPAWRGTPEMFLAFILDLQLRNSRVYSLSEVIQLGELMQKVMKVNLTPYSNFTDLLQRGIPDYSVVDKMKIKLEELKQRTELKKAIYGKDVDLGDDDVMNSKSEGAVFARKFIKDLSKYVDFPDGQDK